MSKILRLNHGGLQGGKCCCHRQRQLELLNCQMSLSMIATIGLLIIQIAAVHDIANFNLILSCNSPLLLLFLTLKLI